MYRHWKFKVVILQEIPAPLQRCNQCRIHTLAAGMGPHSHTNIRNRDTEMQLRKKDLEIS